MSKYYNIGDTVGYWTLIEEVPKPEGRVYKEYPSVTTL